MPMLFNLPPPPSIPVADAGDYPVRRIFCVGRNYAAHAAEMGNEVEREAPFYFTKSLSAVLPSGGTLPFPPGTADLHHEVELAVALDAGGAVMAMGCALDLTRRDLQARAKEKRQPWDTGKDFEGSAVFAPMRPGSEIGDRRITLAVGGEARQDGRTADMLWSVPEIVAHLGGLYRLGAGDVILTGTPAGVGALNPGDEIVARIDGLPELTLAIADPA